MKIGATIWRFDANRRVYRERKPAESYRGGPPIWREHWRPETIKSETSRSWITNYDTKVPKKGADPRVFAFSQEEIDRAAYVYDNRYRITRAVEQIDDYELLCKVAALIGYKPVPPDRT